MFKNVSGKLFPLAALPLIAACSLFAPPTPPGSPEAPGPRAKASGGIENLLTVFGNTELGRQIDDGDRSQATQAATRAFDVPPGTVIHWTNPQNGHSGTVVSTREGYNPAAAYCREYQVTLMIAGKGEQSTGQACREGKGPWKIVN